MNDQRGRLTEEDLIEYFRKAVVPPEENRIGVEYELFCFRRESRTRLGFDGVPGLEWLLTRLLELGGGEAVEEEGRVVGIDRPGCSVSIEPGGQIEASFSPCRTVGECARKLEDYLKWLKAAGGDEVDFIASGVDPVTPLESVPWVPKRRYRIMRRYWENQPGLSLDMMGQTAAVQVSIDYNSQADAVAKLTTALNLSCLLNGLLANSPVYQGSYRHAGSFRQKIWCRTDRERSGVPGICARRIASFVDYVDYALGIPMIFIRLGGRLEPMEERFTFRDFLQRGWRGEYPDIADWRLHLNTIFSLVRFNNTACEVRLFDSNRPELVAASAALVKGVFYSGREFSPLTTPVELLAAARENLDRPEAGLLQPLELLIEESVSPGDRARRAFKYGGIDGLLEILRI
jgi:glutamate--cysteine ligase